MKEIGHEKCSREEQVTGFLREVDSLLAHWHGRYDAKMIYLKLRKAGLRVNHWRVDRIYDEAGLQVKRRKRKKLPVSDRHPLARLQRANQVWSMNLVFDRIDDRRVIKILPIVDQSERFLFKFLSELLLLI